MFPISPFYFILISSEARVCKWWLPRQRKISMKGNITSSFLNSHCLISFRSFLISFAHMAHWLLLILMMILKFNPSLVTQSTMWPCWVGLGGHCSIHKRQRGPWTRRCQVTYTILMQAPRSRPEVCFDVFLGSYISLGDSDIRSYGFKLIPDLPFNHWGALGIYLICFLICEKRIKSGYWEYRMK